ncbi:hypothetical protein CR513_03887, partial [Mucuna pruriens]
MTVRTKIDVHFRMLLMEFGDNLLQFNIFEVMRPPTEDPSLFGNDVIDELVAEYMQLEIGSAEFSNFVEDINVIDCLGSMTDESDFDELLEVQDLSDSEDDIVDLANLDLNSKLVDLIDRRAKVQVAETEKPLQAQPTRTETRHGLKATRTIRQMPNRVGQLKLRPTIDISPLHSPPKTLKLLLAIPNHNCQQPPLRAGGEIVASLKAPQEGNRVVIVKPSRNKSLNLYA